MSDPEIDPKAIWSRPAEINAMISDFAKVIDKCFKEELDPNDATHGFNILSAFQAIAKDKDLVQSFAQSHIPSKIVRLMIHPDSSKISWYKAPFMILILTIMDCGGEGAAEWLATTEVMEEVLRTIINAETWEQMKVCIFIVEKFILTNFGLQYISKLSPRFHAVDYALSHALELISMKPNILPDDFNLYKTIVKMYLRFTTCKRLLKILAHADLIGGLKVYNQKITSQDSDAAELYATFHELLTQFKVLIPGVNLFPFYGTVMGLPTTKERSQEQKFKYLEDQLKMSISYISANTSQSTGQTKGQANVVVPSSSSTEIPLNVFIR